VTGWAGADSAPSHGSDASTSRGRAGLEASTLARAEVSARAQPDAVEAIGAFTTDLYRRLAVSPGNLVCSPYSVAVALAMTRNGARGSTAAQMDAVLHAPPLNAFNDGLNALTQLIESRAGRQVKADGEEASIALDVANSLWGEQTTHWQGRFLDALARNFGAGMQLVDYIGNADLAQNLINQWTADKTHDRITDIIPDLVLDALTRIVLVNSIYLKAPWEEPFTLKLTRPLPFERADGSMVQADTMAGPMRLASYGQGPGWRAAQLPYAGRRLAMTVVLPDQMSLGQLGASIDGPRLRQILISTRPAQQLAIRLPRWKFLVRTPLKDQLAAMGMPIAFDPNRADFSKMTADEALSIAAVLHQAFIAVDEEGTEAAAATAAVMMTTSMPQTTVFEVDRAFLFVIHDVETATPLFIGRVDDPTAALT